MVLPTDHTHPAPLNERLTGRAALLIVSFMGVEVVGGLLSGSLALLADAAHMATDAVALTLAWWAFVQARRPADARRTYGFSRVQVLAAFANGLGLAALVLWLTVEAIGRLLSPQEVAAVPMLVIAVLGLAVNVAAFLILRGAERDNLNIRGALVHVMGDLLGSVAAIIGAAIILTTGYVGADAWLSLVVAALLAKSAWGLIRDSARILLEASPPGLEITDIAAAVRAQVPGVAAVRHVHAWMLTETEILVTLDVVIDDPLCLNATVERVATVLREDFGISHATVQLTSAQPPDACAP